jgi:hypothetical protein
MIENMHSSQNPSWDERHLNLIKDGGRRVMYGGDAYEDDVEPAPGMTNPECQRGAPSLALGAGVDTSS